MKKFLTPMAALSLIAIITLLALAGCLGTQAAETQPSSASGPAVQNPSAPVTTAANAIPKRTIPAGALKMGATASFGSDAQNPATITLQRYAIWDKYEWKNTYWGNHFFNTTPAEGNKFLVLYLEMSNPGPNPCLHQAPPSSYCTRVARPIITLRPEIRYRGLTGPT